ncbi:MULTISPECIES: hypothetical protein [Mesorhizobium]|uniref:hypothetical protein n=1 Tax=Mesorhizobium TaxID=68287 RepID=UPI0007A94766|nr:MULTISPECIES: hypothetical protein [Mesorhizobium]AMX93629.1 hypothetical protein A4R28_11230 [Mesorhizobium ciceri]MDF3208320.1 hypothetical protein [Mesorhizobium sp. LMG15046]MDF3229108.1 hypothetical protein [Mesorhizobium sp. DSM 30133]RUU22217.1 hypothetical protein EOC84_03660 [Mesorhizobium sp. Primo-B]RUU37873.1 hypothetical protein EOC83_16555 [Mesorhizobium sp. Primo-A]
MRANMLDGGAYSRTAFAAINKTAVAAGSGDATEVDCAWIDRELEGIGMAQSAKLVIAFTATLETGETLTFAGNFQDATALAGTGVADFATAFAAAVVATGDSGGSVETGTYEVDIDLAGARQFVRTQITPNLSRGATDTCEWSAVLVLYGDHNQPSTQATYKLGTADAI